MDELKKRLLEYLYEVDREVESYPLQEVANQHNWPHENLKIAGQQLADDKLIDFRKVPGGYYYFRILPAGKKVFWSRRKKIMEYCTAHHLVLIGLAISLIGNLIALVAYFWPR